MKTKEKIIQISGDYKQLWALTNLGNVYAKNLERTDTSLSLNGHKKNYFSFWKVVDEPLPVKKGKSK